MNSRLLVQEGYLKRKCGSVTGLGHNSQFAPNPGGTLPHADQTMSILDPRSGEALAIVAQAQEQVMTTVLQCHLHASAKPECRNALWTHSLKMRKI